MEETRKPLASSPTLSVARSGAAAWANEVMERARETRRADRMATFSHEGPGQRLRRPAPRAPRGGRRGVALPAEIVARYRRGGAGQGPRRAGGNRARQRRHPAHLRRVRARRLVRAGLRARPGPALADGIPAP